MKTIAKISDVKLLHLLRSQLSYRWPMNVRYSRTYLKGNTYPVCPRCRSSMEREYMSYCSRCGQCLAWSEYEKYDPK